jgi:HEAT repeat protein
MKKLSVFLILVAFASASVFAQDKKEEPKKEEPKKVEAKERTVQEYIADLGSDKEEVVIEASNKLGEKKEETAVAKLLELTKGDKRDKVRLYAAVNLGLISSDKKTSDQLSDFILIEQNSDVRYAQVLAISRIGFDSKRALNNLTAARDKETDPFIKDFVAKMEKKWKGEK